MARPQTSRRFTVRRPQFELLDRRELLAADLLLDSPLVGDTLEVADAAPLTTPVTTYSASGLADGAEGEGATATDLMTLARAIAASGTKFYGAAWCPFCTQQKELFADAAYYLPFIEATNPDRSLNAAGQAASITSFPTWIFPDGSRVTGVQTLETLAQRSGVTITQSSAPELLPLADLTIQAGSPRWIALNAFDPNLDNLTYTVTTDNPSLLTLQVPEGNRSLQVNVRSWGAMKFQLFDHLVPEITERIASHAEIGFYDKTSVNNSIVTKAVQTGNVRFIQLGDPTGVGTASSGLGPVDDQFDSRLQYNAAGYLGLVKTTDDSGDVQFFVTDAPARELDFNVPIFGVLTEGEKVRHEINRTATTNDKPVRDVIIDSVQVIQDTEDRALMISAAPGATGTANVTVTVRDPSGNTAQRTFQVTVEADTANGGPFLKPVRSVVTGIAQTVSWQLQSVDVEGDAVRYEASVVGGNAQVSVNSTTGLVTLTPNAGFTGTVQIFTGVRAGTGVANNTSDPVDSQVVSVQVQADPRLWQNPDRALDTDGDNVLAPRDVLVIVNELNFRVVTSAAGVFTSPRPALGPDFLYYDTSGDNLLTPRDALLVINELNGNPASEGEGEGEASTPLDATLVDAALAAYWLEESNQLAKQRTANR
jgi:cyclophilin family peptidyl-prolyl cis-trans isomerase